jgi:uncharacterized membrane protein YkoI
MKRPTRAAGTAAVCLALTALFCTTALAETETPQFKGSIAVEPHAKQMSGLATKTLSDAFATASTAANAGQAVEAELGAENGFLVYGFNFIAPSGVHTKVLVDAGDGKLLATLKEEADTDTLQVEEGDGEQVGDHQDGNDGPDLTAAEAAKARASLSDAVKAALVADPGKAVAVKLSSEKDVLAYEVSVIGTSGEAISVAVNAFTGKVLTTGEEKDNGGEKENGEEEGNEDGE